MNKIVRKHYPVANLPEDLREGLSNDATVRIVLEVEDRAEIADDRSLDFRDFQAEASKPLTRKEALEAIRRFKAQDRPSVSLEDAVARIRVLRDEWDD
ncbi:hypothetical protein IE4803_CH00198 [Rhizobium etli bv. phaseoli str. IE4803]|nr:hypothetical protein IE4803_CH00198 [Rhizobium etli bv. phaseoli str. IE4803]